MPNSISRVLRQTCAGRVLLDYYPRPSELYGDLKVHVPGRVKSLFDTWKANQSLEAESKAAYIAYPGGDFLDIGAYHGWYSWLLAPKACKGSAFVSFEPDSNAYPTLLYNLSVLSAQFDNVSVMPIPKPVGNGSPMSITFPSGSDGHPQFASSKEIDGGQPTLAVDSVVYELKLRPSFIKVDVEGAEYFVLQGMKQILSEFRPIISLELHPRWQPEGVGIKDVEEILISRGYKKDIVDESSAAIRQLWT